MKKALLVITLAFMYVSQVFSQNLIVPENDSTFVAEYQDGIRWGFVTRDSLIVGISNKYTWDKYGTYYQLNILVKNLTNRTFDFDPSTVQATLVPKSGESEEMKVYTADKIQKKIKNTQTFTAITMGLNLALNGANAGYQTADVYSPYGYYSVETYNSGCAALANLMAMNLINQMGEQMKNERETRDAGYLKTNTMHPGDGICGYMLVKKQKGKEMVVNLIVGGEKFTFRWDLQKKK